jgi:hypothetical protein
MSASNPKWINRVFSLTPVQTWALATSSSFRLMVVLMHIKMPFRYAWVKPAGFGLQSRRFDLQALALILTTSPLNAKKKRGGPDGPPRRSFIPEMSSVSEMLQGTT